MTPARMMRTLNGSACWGALARIELRRSRTRKARGHLCEAGVSHSAYQGQVTFSGSRTLSGPPIYPSCMSHLRDRSGLKVSYSADGGLPSWGEGEFE